MEARAMKNQNPRKAAWFISEIRRQIKKDPTRPARFDITRAEFRAVDEAYDELAFGKNKAITRWRYCITRHADPRQHLNGLWRAAFFGPSYPRPAPVKEIPLRLHGKNQRSQRIEVRKNIEALRQKYGPDYYIEYPLVPKGGNRIRKCFIFRVWRGEDWLAEQTAAFYPVEIARYVPAPGWLYKDVERGRKMVKAQAQRRAEWSRQRQDEWGTWQEWIEKKCSESKWSFPFGQRQASNHFGVSLKSIRRRTAKKPGQAD
jgi:hypothetical protein